MARLFLILGSILVSIAIAEAVLRLADYPHDVRLGWGGSGIQLHSPNEPNSDQDLVVVLLGDSQVTNRGKIGAELPGALLERRLTEIGGDECLQDIGKTTFRVVSIGAGGWGQDQQLIALTNYFKTNTAQLVVLWETPENDMWNNAFPTHYPLNGKPKPTFVISENGALKQVKESEIIPPWMQTKLGLLIAHLPGAELWDPDRAWDRYLPPTSDIKIRVDTDSKDYLDVFNHYIKNDPVFLEKSHLVLGLNENSPRIAYMVQLTEQLIMNIRDVAKNSKADFFAFSYSAQNTDQPLYPPSGEYSIDGHPFSFSTEAASQRLAALNKHIECHQIELNLKEWRHDANDPHLSPAGNKEIINSLARIILGKIC